MAAAGEEVPEDCCCDSCGLLVPLDVLLSPLEERRRVSSRMSSRLTLRSENSSDSGVWKTSVNLEAIVEKTEMWND